jgi:hypothetical protein
MSSSTEEQERVIRNMDKNTMVIACPGSGKSFTMKEGDKSHFSTSSFGQGIPCDLYPSGHRLFKK